MSFKSKRNISLLLTALPVIFMLACMIMADFIIKNDLLVVTVVIIAILIVLSLASTFVLTRCPHCNKPIPSVTLLMNNNTCPYCDKEYDKQDGEDITA